MAYDLVKKLKNTGNEIILQQLSDVVNASDKKNIHEVFEHSFDIKECFTEKFIIQKLNYIHFNPCTENGIFQIVRKIYYAESPIGRPGYDKAEIVTLVWEEGYKDKKIIKSTGA